MKLKFTKIYRQTIETESRQFACPVCGIESETISSAEREADMAIVNEALTSVMATQKLRAADIANDDLRICNH